MDDGWTWGASFDPPGLKDPLLVPYQGTVRFSPCVCSLCLLERRCALPFYHIAA
jgi:hypothetical protein